MQSEGVLMDATAMVRRREELAEILGVAGPVPEKVLAAAVEDEAYARNLLLCRRDPDLLQHLLDNPPRRKPRFSRTELATRAAGALARWAKTGFTFVEDDVRRRRLAACEACPDLIRGDNALACGLCGCRVEWKTRLSSESCPAPHDEFPNLTRWREPQPNHTKEAVR